MVAEVWLTCADVAANGFARPHRDGHPVASHEAAANAAGCQRKTSVRPGQLCVESVARASPSEQATATTFEPSALIETLSSAIPPDVASGARPGTIGGKDARDSWPAGSCTCHTGH